MTADRAEPATRNSARTQRAVLDAASRVISQRGGDVSLTLIAKEAEVSKSGLLHHYPTRERLLAAVAEDSLDRFRSVVMEFVDLAENRPGKVLRGYIRALCGGSPEAVAAFSHSALWSALSATPGVGELLVADGARWEEAFAQDGLDPDTVLVARHAAEGFAVALHFDPTVPSDRAAHMQDLLIALTDGAAAPRAVGGPGDTRQ